MEPIKYPLRLPSEPGIILLDYGPNAAGLRFQARVWDERKRIPKSGKLGGYETLKHATLAEAAAWARTKKAEFTLGMARAGRLTLDMVRDDFLTYVKAKKNRKGKTPSEAHIKEIADLLDDMKRAGITDLKDDKLATRAIQFISCRKSKKSRPRKDEVLRRRHHNGFSGEAAELAPETIHRLVGHMRHLGNWCVGSNLLVNNPFAMVPKGSLPDRLPRTYTLDECRRLVSDEAVKSFEGLLFATLLYTTMREQEAVWLRGTDFNFRARMIRVVLEEAREADDFSAMAADEVGKRVKRDKERLVLIPDELADLLGPYAMAAGDGFVFPDALREKSQSQLWDRFITHCEALKVKPQPRAVHALRATGACLQLASGMIDSLSIVDNLGHTDADTSLKYVRSARMFKLETAGWGGQIRLRRPIESACNSRATEPVRKEAKEGDEAPPEDDIEGELFVVLNDNSPISSSLFGATPQIANPCTPVRFRVAPPMSIPDPDSELEDPPPPT
jgi:integrase